jgi:hypothetical protein
MSVSSGIRNCSGYHSFETSSKTNIFQSQEV